MTDPERKYIKQFDRKKLTTRSKPIATNTNILYLILKYQSEHINIQWIRLKDALNSQRKRNMYNGKISVSNDRSTVNENICISLLFGMVYF